MNISQMKYHLCRPNRNTSRNINNQQCSLSTTNKNAYIIIYGSHQKIGKSIISHILLAYFSFIDELCILQNHLRRLKLTFLEIVICLVHKKVGAWTKRQ